MDQLFPAAEKAGGITQDDFSGWISLYTNAASPSYDPHFYKEIQDLGQIAGVAGSDLLNLSSLSPEKLTDVLSRVTNVFLIIQANPPPVLN